MLQSDWSPLACLPGDLQLFLVILEGFLELAEGRKRVADVRVRLALARFVACSAKGFENFQRISNAAL